MRADELMRRLQVRAQNLADWCESALKFYENRTEAEIETVYRACRDDMKFGDGDELYRLYLWESFQISAGGWLDNIEEMHDEIGLQCIPPLEVVEYGLFIALTLARSAAKHFQSESHKKHLLATHLLCDASEARIYWTTLRGLENCRIPDPRFVKVRDHFQKWESIKYIRETRSSIARNAADVRHSMTNGSRDRRKKIRSAWADGNYRSRDICAEQEYSALGFGSFKAARNALKNTPPPNPWPAKKKSKTVSH